MSILQLTSLRKPRANKISTTIYFYSPKLNRQVWCESNLEFDTAIVLDHAPEILDYCEQSIELKWSKSKWIPDFVALIEENGEYKIFIIEVKYMQELLGDKEHYIKKYSESQDYIDQNQKIIAQSITKLPVKEIKLIIVTDLILQQSFRVKNLRKLIQSKIENTCDIRLSVEIEKMLQDLDHISIKSLINTVRSIHKRNKPSLESIYATINTMIYNQELFSNLEHLITPDSFVSNYCSSIIPITYWLTWIKWEDETHLYPPIIQHTDLYYAANTPEKSIRYWQIANSRYQTIIPLLDNTIEELKQKDIYCDGEKISWKTAYRWIKSYRDGKGNIKELIPKYANCGGKEAFISPEAQEVYDYGKGQYMQLERKSILRAYEYMEAKAYKEGKQEYCMSYSSFKRRLKSLIPEEVDKKRIGKRNAEKKYELSESEFPHGTFPLQSVQIDHTPIDVLVVDEENREVTERPYLTIAFDSYTRCVLGYYISYNKPSRLSVAMTLINCVKDKSSSIEKILQQFPELDAEYCTQIKQSQWKDVYGLGYTLHMDNGSNFRSNDVKLFGARYKVHLHYRAVKKPQHGAYVERFLGTLNNRLHGLKGTTYSNTVEKQEYPSEKRAIYTINELEARVLTEILLYHVDYHEKIKTAPIKLWKDAFSYKNKKVAVSRNLSHINTEFFHLDVLPSETRTVQKRGVQNFGLDYSDPRIKKWIGVKDLNNTKEKKKFRIRYDPRDIRTIFFYDPDEEGYYPLQCSDEFVNTYYSDVPLTMWQWEAIKNNIKHNYHYSSELYKRKKYAFLLAQESMDKEVASRSKSVRIKRARHLHNLEHQKEFEESVGLTEADIKEIENMDFSAFEQYEDEDIEEIYIPPAEENPFAGIYAEQVDGEWIIKKRGEN